MRKAEYVLIGLIIGVALSILFGPIALREPPFREFLYDNNLRKELQTHTLQNRRDFTWTLLTTFKASRAIPVLDTLGFKSWTLLNPKPELVFLSGGEENE